jgi:hypothetical protein
MSGIETPSIVTHKKDLVSDSKMSQIFRHVQHRSHKNPKYDMSSKSQLRAPGPERKSLDVE